MNSYNFNQNVYAYVNGVEGARAYQIMPNQTVLLIDTDNPYIYMKTANAMGQCSMQYFKIEQVKEDLFVKKNITQEDYDKLLKRIEELEGKKNESII